MSPPSPRAALAQSLRVKQQRAELSAIGARLGTEVLFLKGAWAEPVLYDGRGGRWSNDIDILVRPAHYAAFGRALEALGLAPRSVRTHRATLEAQKARLYDGHPTWLPVDLHRGLVEEPWFRLDAAACIARAVAYPSVDGPVLSLSPTDQLLFAAAHYAGHGLELDERHLEDAARLWERHAIDGAALRSAARHAGLDTMVAWLGRALARRGCDVPATLTRLHRAARLRLELAEGLAGSRRARAHLAETKRRVLELGLLSDRPSALPRFVTRYARLRLADLRRLRDP